jgi:hypothetical protein
MPTVLSTTELIYHTYNLYCAFHVRGCKRSDPRLRSRQRPVHDPRRIGGDAVDVGPVDERNGNGID